MKHNVSKLLTVEPDDHKHTTNLYVFYGVRVFMIYWICAGHYFIEKTFYSANQFSWLHILKGKWALTGNMAYLAVDFFFWMGGFFSGFVLVKKLGKLLVKCKDSTTKSVKAFSSF